MFGGGCKYCDRQNSQRYNECHQPIVIDMGSGMTKAGYAGNDIPSCMFPTIIGRMRHSGVFPGMCADKHSYVGDDASRRRGILSMKYPVDKGIIGNWDYFERIMYQIFECELCIKPENQSILLTEIATNLKLNRKKMTEIIFETFNMSSMYLAVQSALSLYATGRLTGIVLDSGYSVTHSVPIHDGYVLQQKTNQLDIGGSDLTNYLMHILTERGYSFTTTAEREIVKDIKVKLGYVSLNFEDDMKQAETSSHIEKYYQLPDGQVITVGAERFRCPEIIFCPQTVGKSGPGVHNMIDNSIRECSVDIRRILYENIVLSGDNMLFHGMVDRLKKEIISLVPNSAHVDVSYACPYSKEKNEVVVDGFLRRNNKKKLYDDVVNMIYEYTHYSLSNPTPSISWVGGSIFASLPSFNELCIAKNDYQENGKGIVNRKMFLNAIY